MPKSITVFGCRRDCASPKKMPEHLLKLPGHPSNLVSMTRLPQSTPPASLRSSWPLQDAKARFSELVRRACTEGPQHVTVHGREEVVIIGVNEFRRLKGAETGAALVAALQTSPCRDTDLEPARKTMPVRAVDL